MERRSILEKLGLIEKVENEDVENIQAAGNEEINNPVETEKSQFINHMKKAEIQLEPNDNSAVKTSDNSAVKTSDKISLTTNAEDLSEESEDPVALVRKKKLLKIAEIYKNYEINTDGINSLSIVESFQKALPDYLPTDVKRQSILNIIESSNVKVENLIKDGNEKLNCLKEFSQSFSNESNEVVSNFEKEIKKLNEKINNYKTAIDNMKNLQTEQDFTVKYEMEKISNILQFINTEN